jgi:hypothetical protein
LAQNAFRWLDDKVNFTKRAAMRATIAQLIGNADCRRDPREMIAKMVEAIPANAGKFRTVFPPAAEDKIREHQAEMFDRMS